MPRITIKLANRLLRPGAGASRSWRRPIVTIILLSWFGFAGNGFSGEAAIPDNPSAGSGEADTSKKPKPDVPEDVLVESEHVAIVTGAAPFGYRATAGNLVLMDADDNPSASIFFVSYTRTDVENPEKRPVMFCFNGGPGSSAVWLHLGAFGPRRVLLEKDGLPTRPPYGITNNVYSILDVTDLVFIDPVSTGYSRAIPPDQGKKFHSIKTDIESVGDFIRRYVTRFERWGSPKFVAGESYGGLRAAGLAADLHDRFGMDLNGVLFVSPVLNFQTIGFHPGNDLPYALALPSCTAAAWYHRKLVDPMQAQSLDEVLAKAEEFVSGKYITTLFNGAEIGEKTGHEVAARIAELSGLSADYVEASNLRVHPMRFAKELLRGTGRTLGRFDARVTGTDRDSAGESPEYDPSYDSVYGPFSTAFNHYIRTGLNFKEDRPYEILAGTEVRPWEYEPYENRYVDVAEDLRQAMNKTPFLRALFACGTFDMATPYLATIHTVQHLGLSPDRQRNVTVHRYNAGHMFYTDEKELAPFAADVRSFLKASK